MKVTVLCSRPHCTPPHPCSECQALALQVTIQLRSELSPSREALADRSVHIQR
ncbi:MAG: hypothetical protein ACREMZ_16265 [Gemmatimonadales bacterium]